MTAVEFKDIYNNIIEMFGSHLIVTMIANGVSVTERGTIEKTTGSAVVMRTDSGRVRFFSISSIFSVEPALETDSDGTVPPANAAEEAVIDEPIHEYIRKDYSEDIRIFIKENTAAQKRANQIINILSNAKKNHVMQEKEGRLCMALKSFLNDFGDNRSACLFAADIYEQMNRYEDAIAIYKFCGETDNARYCAYKSGDTGLVDRVAAITLGPAAEQAEDEPVQIGPGQYTGEIDIWSAEGIYGFLRSDEEIQGTNKIFFHLSCVWDDRLREYLYRIPKLPVQRIRVAFVLGNNNGQLAAAHIVCVSPTDFDQMSFGSSQILSGFLVNYDAAIEFGRISDGIKEYNFYLSACQDPYMKYYLKNSFRYSDIDVRFTIKKNKGKDVVDRLAASESGRKYIVSELDNVQWDPKFEDRTPEEFLTGLYLPAKTDIANLPGYKELPSWESVPAENTGSREIGMMTFSSALRLNNKVLGVLGYIGSPEKKGLLHIKNLKQGGFIGQEDMEQFLDLCQQKGQIKVAIDGRSAKGMQFSLIGITPGYDELMHDES